MVDFELKNTIGKGDMYPYVSEYIKFILVKLISVFFNMIFLDNQ